MISIIIENFLFSLYFIFSNLSLSFIILISPRVTIEKANEENIKIKISEIPDDSISKLKHEKTKIKRHPITIINSKLGTPTFKLIFIFYSLNSFVYYIIFSKLFSTTILISLITMLLSNFIGTYFRIVAITGQTASGKSFMSRRIKEKFKKPVIDLDKLNKEVLNKKDVITQISKVLGDSVLNTDGTLNKTEIRNIVFHDKDKLKRLERITHKKVFLLFIKRVLYHKIIKRERFLFIENAILLKLPTLMRLCFPIISVVCSDKENLVKRIEKRDSCSEDIARNMLSNQLHVNEYIIKSDYVICNDRSMDEFVSRVDDFILFFTGAKQESEFKNNCGCCKLN